MKSWQEKLSSDIEKVLISEKEIALRITELAQEISKFYQTHNIHEITVVGILRGSVVFMSDLIRKLDLDVQIDFMAVSSYDKGTVSSGTVRIIKDLSDAIENKHVLIIEDIIDTGITLDSLQQMLLARNPASLRLCSLLNKPSRRLTEVAVDFCGFVIEDEFVVGYGLDYSGEYRNIPYIGTLKKKVYKK